MKGAALVTLALALAAAAAACGDPATTEMSGVATEGVPSAVSTVDAHTLATTFDGYPVLWLGDSYDSDGDGVGDMALHWANVLREPPFYLEGRLVDPGAYQFDLAYGACTPLSGRDECTAPISIGMSAADDPQLSDAVKTGQTVEVRGTEFIVFSDGDLYLHTPQYAITIAAGGLPWAIGVANQLVGANPKGAYITRQTDFYGNALTGPRPTRTPSPVPTPRPYGTAPAPICTIVILPGEITPGPIPGCTPSVSPTAVATVVTETPSAVPSAAIATAEAP
jgi:hypothetical protein